MPVVSAWIAIGLCAMNLLSTVQQPGNCRRPIRKSKEVFHLRAEPAKVTPAELGQPINIKLVLTNHSRRTLKVRIYGWPVPFGTRNQMNCIRLRCTNAVTGKEVKYSWPPDILSVAEAQGREHTEEVPPGKSWLFPLNLRDYCDLPPGRYRVEFKYDTESIPSWVKPDKDSWHGTTNMVVVQVRVAEKR